MNMTNVKQPFIERHIIMTPGPVEVHPNVLKAMQSPIIGQFDEKFLSLMDETMEMTREIFQTKNHWAYPIVGTARAGIEALLSATLEPGDKAYVPIFGRFGHLIAEIAKRTKANVHTSEIPLGEVYSFETLKKEIDASNPKVVAIVHGESSTGMMQPLKALGKYCQKQGIILIVDAVATIGGTDFKMDEWGIDGAITGSQKCLAAPAGMALISYNKKIESIINAREKYDQGLDPNSINDRMISSNYLDLSQLQAYWSPKRLNHHTEATSMLYAVHEALRLTLEEGLDKSIKRHTLNMNALSEGLKAMGLHAFGDKTNHLPTIKCFYIPKGIDSVAFRQKLVNDYHIEIAPGFGPLKDNVWRIGALGYSSRKQNVLILLNAIESLLLYYGASINTGKAFLAANKVYKK